MSDAPGIDALVLAGAAEVHHIPYMVVDLNPVSPDRVFRRGDADPV